MLFLRPLDIGAVGSHDHDPGAGTDEGRHHRTDPVGENRRLIGGGCGLAFDGRFGDADPARGIELFVEQHQRERGARRIELQVLKTRCYRGQSPGGAPPGLFIWFALRTVAKAR